MAKRNVIEWDDDDRGIAPDGTRYWLASEHIRGEPRMWWAEVQTRNGSHAELRHPTDDWAISKAKAKQAAEHHYRMKIEKESRA